MQQYSTILMIVAMIALFYFLILRPQKKRQQKVQETLNSLTPGTDVLLASGVFGKIVEIGEKQAVLEVSPGVELTVLKQAISRVTTEADLEPLDEDEDDDEENSELSDGSFTVPDDASSLTGSADGASQAYAQEPSTTAEATTGEPSSADLARGDQTAPDQAAPNATAGDQTSGEHVTDGISDAPGEPEKPSYERPTFERPSFERAEFDTASDEGHEGPHDPKKA